MFKVGDRVRRINDNWFGMRVGDAGTIIRITNVLYFNEYDGGHSPLNFVIDEITNWRKEVEGQP